MMLLIAIADSLVVVGAIAVAFCFFGAPVQRFLLGGRLPEALRAGICYFSGAGMFLVVWKAADAGLKNARLSLAATLALLLLLALSSAGTTVSALRSSAVKLGRRGLLRLAALAAATWAGVFVYWCSPINQVYFHTNVGMMAAVKNANLAIFAVHQHYLPHYGQHHGAALLAAAGMLLGAPYPYLNLNAFLSVSMFFALLLFYGLFQWLGLSARGRAIGLALVMSANAGLSLVHVVVLDSGFPVMLLGTADALLGIGTLFSFLIWVHQEVVGGPLSGGRFAVRAGVAGVVWAGAWNCIGSQNIPLALAVLGAAAALVLLRRRYFNRKLLGAACAVALAAASSLPFGGMLTPKRWQEQNPPKVGNQTIDGAPRLWVALPYVVPGPVAWEYWTQFEPRADVGSDWAEAWSKFRTSPAEGAWLLRGTALKTVFLAETLLWTALRIMFVPLLALALHYFALRGRYASLVTAPKFATDHLAFASAFLLAAGFFPAFLLSMGGDKWAMSRLMMPAYVLGAILFACVAYELTETRLGSPRARYAFPTVAAVLAIGPLTTACFRVAFNMFFVAAHHQPSTLDFFLRSTLVQ